MLQSAFCFVFLPTLAANLLSDYQLANEMALRDRPEILLLLILCQLILGLILLWGMACVLSIGKRVLQAKSGRTRTSFKTVRSQAAGTFIPLLLTSVLRSIITVLWGILLIVPGIVYFFRTAFYPVIVACEGVSYRPALKQCLELSRGKFWSIAGSILGLSILTLLPAGILSSLLSLMAKDLGMPALVAADIASGLLFTLALTLYLIGLIEAYDYYKPKAHVRN